MAAKPTEERSIKEALEHPILISKVIINGVNRTKDDFVKSLAKGFFQAKTVKQFIIEAQSVQQKFNDLDVTDGCKIKLDVGDDSESLYVHIDMREKNTWKGNIQGFMGNDNDARMGIGGCLSAFGLFRNIWGRGEKASCIWTKGVANGKQEILLQKPLSPKYESMLSGSIFNYNGDVTLSGYKEKNSGLALNLQIPSGPLEHKLSWTGVWRQLIAMNDRTAFAVREQAGHSLKSSVQYELSHDSRDDTVLPSRGQYMKLTQELAGLGGNAHFYSKLLSVQTNHELIDRVVLQLTSSVGHVQPLNLFNKAKTQPLSIMDKFYLGGPTSLRGFENKGIGPRQLDNALGSDFYWLASAHLRIPLPGVRGGLIDRFRFQLFVNTGNAQDWSSASNMNDRFNNHLNTARLTYGAGVVTNFLGAKLELNYCIPVKHQPQDKVPSSTHTVGIHIMPTVRLFTNIPLVATLRDVDHILVKAVQHGFQFGISVGD